MADFLHAAAAHVWNRGLIVLILLTGLYFSVRMRFPQLTQLKEMLRLLGARDAGASGISPLQSFVFTAARTFGVGNIAGMAAGMYFGGPGTLFWLWVLAFFGAAIAILEGTLAQTFKRPMRGGYRGGPAYYMVAAMRPGRLGKIFGLCYSVVTVISLTFLMPEVQSYYIVQGLNEAFGADRLLAGIVLTVLLALVIQGGLNRMGRATYRISPTVGTLYVLVSLFIIFANLHRVPEAFFLILRSAWGRDAAFGGITAFALQWGIRRGVQANEVAVGTSAIISSTSEVSHPVQQGLLGGLSVYIGTLFVCTTTTFMILLTDSYNVQSPSGGFVFEGLPGVEYGNPFVSHAIQRVIPIPNFGNVFVALAIFFFAFVALSAFYLHAESNLAYLLGNHPAGHFILRVLFLGSVFFGTQIAADTIWAMADIGFGMMAWINLFSLLLTGHIGVRIYYDYINKRKTGVLDPPFLPKDTGITHGAEVWESLLNRKEENE